MSLSDCLSKINKGKPVFNQKEIEELKALVKENARSMPQDQAEKAAVQTLLDEAVAERKQIDALVREALPAIEEAPVIKEPVEPTVKNELYQEKKTERRESKEERRTRYKNMTADEKVLELERRDMEARTSYLTGLPNRLEYDEGDRSAVQASADIDGMKGVNDTLGHAAGDSLIRAKAGALKAAMANEPSIKVYHLSGDEFVAEADTVEEIDRVMNVARKELMENGFEYVAADGTNQIKKGIGFSYGTAKTLEQADKNLHNDKSARKAAGLRTGERDVATRDAGTEEERTGTGNARNERGTAKDLSGRPVNEDGTLFERRGVSQEYNQSATFFSQLSNAIANAPSKVFTSGKQVKAWIESNQAKLGIKKDEIFWTGINEYLDTKDKVTKEEVSAFLEGNGVQVDEVVLGEKGGKSIDEEIEKKYRNDINSFASDSSHDYWYELLKEEAAKNNVALSDLSRTERNDLLDEAMSFSDRVSDVEDNLGQDMKENIENEITGRAQYEESGYSDTKFSPYQLPGGENYKELLLTLPVKNIPDFSQRRTDLEGKNNQGLLSKKEFAELLVLRKTEDTRQTASEKVNFHSGHYDQPNILAHVRFNERIDADGAKVLFIEEIQADFGQAYKKAKDAIGMSVDNDFKGIIDRMKKVNALEVNCD